MINKFLICTLFLVTAACSSKQITPPAMSLPVLHEAGGSYIHADKKENIRYGETLKAYTLGRRIDPFDGSVMHEGGLVYRLENSSSWNLQPGDAASDISGDQKPFLLQDNEAQLRAEIEVKANEQRALYKFIQEAADKASAQIDIIQQSADLSRRLFTQNKDLKSKLEESEKEKIKLSDDIQKLKKQLELLLKLQGQKESESIRSQFRRK